MPLLLLLLLLPPLLLLLLLQLARRAASLALRVSGLANGASSSAALASRARFRRTAEQGRAERERERGTSVCCMGPWY